MAISSEQDSKPPEEICPKRRPPPPPRPSPRVGFLGPPQWSRCRSPPPLQHPPPDVGRRPSPPAAAAAAASSPNLHSGGPPPLAPAAAASERGAVVGNYVAGVQRTSGQSQVPPASRSSAGAAVAKNQLPPLAAADGSRPNLFEEFCYIPFLERKAKHEAIAAARKLQQQQLQQGEANRNCKAPRARPAASCLLNGRSPARSTMAVKTSVKKQQGGSFYRGRTTSNCCATSASCHDGVGKSCHGCLCIHPVGGTTEVVNWEWKAELGSELSCPTPCADDSRSPFDKFQYTPHVERRDRNNFATGTQRVPERPSHSLARCPPVGVTKLRRKKVQAASQEDRQQQYGDKRRKTLQVSAAGKHKNKKPVSQRSQQKPKKAPPVVLTAAEKRLDIYRRLPPDQLIAPRRHTPYNLLQERYAPDPWKVMVICMLLNRTTGKVIKELVDGFFARYPDAQTACDANLEDMVEYLRPTGLQLEKAMRIKKFSFSYLSPDWTYVTQLHGVGKYAADAYAIFCAGRVTEVEPDDHKLVDYWKYVCNIGEPWEDEDSCFAI